MLIHYKRPNELRLLLNELAREYSDFVEVIVVCDNSAFEQPLSEETLPIRQDVEVTYLARLNDGYGAAANAGIRELRARHGSLNIAFIATHDLKFRPPMLRQLVEKSLRRPDFGISGPLLLDARTESSVWSTGGLLTNVRQDARHIHELPDAPVIRQWLDGSALLINLSALDEVRGFAESFFLYKEDVEICCRMSDAGYSVVVVPTAVAEQAPGGHDSTYLSVRNTFWLHIGNRRVVATALWLIENVIRAGAGFLSTDRSRRRRQVDRCRAIAHGMTPPPEIARRTTRKWCVR